MKITMITCISTLAGLGRTYADCIPSRQRDAPGVGIDLTMAYVAVAIHFENGTTVDIARIDGSSEYLGAMRSLAEDARQFDGLGPRMDCTHEPTQTFYPPLFMMEWWRAIRAWFHTDTNPPSDPYQPDRWVDTIADTLSSIKSDILDTLDLPVSDRVFTTWPDFEAGTGSLYRVRFRLACHRAGLDHLDGEIASYHALGYDGILVEDDQDEDGVPAGPRAMLVISYSAASLGVTLNIRDGGIVWPRRLVENPELGAARNSDATYWGSVKLLLEEVVQDEPVDHILLLGPQAYDAGLIRAVLEVVDQHENINSSVLERYRGADLDMRDEDLPVFMAARQAAAVARDIITARSCVVDEKATSEVHSEL
ncbi:hypothetical protein BJX68DRAFT_269281 [Aspergillus pseudodeflectus]|uniref:Uncharacterized protein n=1 Tax=Aspergillus pseudodeflectus TaxID=176178 RepID=A0ABR4JYF5_9EURO